MSLYSLSIRRPVLSTVLSTMIIIFGAVGFYFLGVREYPSVSPPVISVTTEYRGANADVIDSQITEPLEEQINGIDGIRTISSVSRAGRSTVTVEFDLGADLERAANDVRDRVSRARRVLPTDAEPPSVSKSDADAPPIVFLNIKSDQRNLMELTEIADKRFKERLQTIEGVSRVDVWGEKTFAMRLWFDPGKLAAYNLTPLDIRSALDRSNVELPSGRIEGESIELTVRTMGRLETVEDFESLILKQSESGETVRMKDVGRVEIAPRNMRTLLQRDGIPMVGVVLRPLPGANYIDIVDQFYERLETIKADLPTDLELGIGFDNTEPIRQSIDEVQQTIFLAFLLVVFIIFAFLRDWRSTVIPLLVIPVALIGAFFIMYMAGFSINVLTLLAIVLAIGLVVDDAIVVLENIYSKIEEGKPPIEAGIEGTREIFFAVIATSIALVVIFTPIVFMGGLTGQLFQEFGLVIAGAVAISSFVALTLTPMLSSRLLKQREEKPWIYRKTEPFFQWLTDAYRRTLQAFMEVRWISGVVLIAVIALTATYWWSLPQELAPLEDRSGVRLFATAREGATYNYMDGFVDRLISTVNDVVPEEDQSALITVTSPGFGASTSVNSAFGFARFVDPSERETSQMEYADRLQAAVSKLEGARTFVSQEPTISVGFSSGLPVQYVLQAPSVDRLREVLPTFLERAEEQPELAFVDVDLKFNKPELQVRIDREKADNVGVSPLDVAQTLQLALAEQRVGYFVRDGEQREVIAAVEKSRSNEPVDLTGLFVRTASGEPIMLDNLVTVSEEATPPQIYRFNRYMSATVSARPAPGYTISDGITAMDRVANDVLDPSFSTALDGQSRDFQETSNQLLYVFGLAIILIYLVLAAQFESFRDPFIILLTVPLAMVGALFGLAVFGQTLNIFSQIGLIMLVGLVAKNGILIVEFANQRKAAGLSIRDAIEDAAVARFRPILMTALSTTLGVLPLALGLGSGAQSRVPMGVAVIGGLVIGTLMALYIIPAAYSYLTSEDAGPVLATVSPDSATAPTSGDTGDGIPAEDVDTRQPQSESPGSQR
ncbi:acriflavin resistance protein [Longibacter salinarum]|uniref:Acriflavin resistance protein n=1 Tax=Longibacter salinarum TaxID=1850348 RepID=A0A2A8CXL5_9BACT|nr:efflux RND transporter permease subunit [Longibacter salinarum]PEN13479.1 acriflavin resistance protein [Longibacter salinarum]